MTEAASHETSPEGPPEIIGSFLQLSLSLMEEAGGLGEKLMKKLGIDRFEIQQFYPFQIRHDFYQSILDHLGWEGLFIFGTRITEFVNRATGKNFRLIEEAKPYVLAIQESESQEEVNKHLAEFVVEACRVLSEGGALTRRGAFSTYKWSAIDQYKKGFPSFQITHEGATKLAHEASLRSNFWWSMRQCLPDHIDFSMNFDTDASEQSSGLNKHRFNLDFFPMTPGQSHRKILDSETTRAEKQMLRNAVKYALEQEERVNDLMLNILPAAVADRLKAGQKTISDSCPKATILFSDIVGFTAMSSKKSAEDLVFLLNDLFTQFDRRALVLGLEKIKTIGDAYMVAGGLCSEFANDDAVKVIEMALGMLDDLAEFNQKFDMNLGLRVGVNTGPVVAGVIGESKFSYDLWGNTVNTASRMESTSLPGKIQISPSTYGQVKNHFDIQERELIECKGLGKIMTYFVNGPLAGRMG